jgi:hypothetical protein
MTIRVIKQAIKQRIKRTALYGWHVERRAARRERDANKLRAVFVDQVLPKNAIGAELGVFKGQFSPILLERTSPTRLHLIDPWYFLTAHWHWGGGDRSTVHALIRVLQRFEKEIENGRVRVHVGDDLQVLATFPDGYFDWVYVDSSHAYEHTRDELRMLERKIKSGGVIAGDDWQPDPHHRHHGVYKAVTEFVASGRYEVIYADKNDRQWAMRLARQSSA